jgi:hypothetical protein
MFAVIRTAVNPATSILTAIPLIFLGTVLPFYYGYVKGALVRSSTVDRYRGWIFFFVGLGAYGYNLAAQWMNQVLPLSLGRAWYLANVPLAIAAVLGAVIVARRFHHFFFEVLSESSSPFVTPTALTTVMSAFFFAAVFSNVATISNIDLSSGPPLLLLFVGGVYFLRKSGRYAGYANSKVPPTPRIIRGRWYGKRLFSLTDSLLSYAGLLLLLVATLYFVSTTPTGESLVSYFFELVAALLLITVSIPLSRLVGERKVYQSAK